MKQSRLQADPAKTAAWQQRGRGKGLRREKRLARTPKPPRPTTPRDVWEAVLRRDGGLCVWSRYLGRRRKAQHPHHLLPKGAGGWPQFVAERANIVGLTADQHMQHEHSPSERLPWAALPEECREFLRRVCARDPRAERLVSIKYPADGVLSDHPVRERGV